MTPRHLTFHYTLRDEQGRVLDLSRGGQPLACIEGAGQIIDGLAAALKGMKAGESRKVVVPPELGYGLRDDALVQRVPRGRLPVGEIAVGDRFQTGPDVHAPVVTVRAIETDVVVLDANHPLAGQRLFFEVELLTARPATPGEVAAARPPPGD
ncbi:MAG TPA: peptidylprolyl isomerase [Candidatus Didemnitutus sp.]|nr:peptidylprolyl isomerase [Candidatus Didemnitutus sp.]